jgi:DNA-binding transcriptional MerR regulator
MTAGRNGAVMLKIGEFSQLGQVTVRALRHYDELDLLKPAYINPESDYRYYTIEQLPALHRIVALKEMGLPLSQIRELLAGAVSTDTLRGLLQERERSIERQIAAERQRLARVAGRLRLIEQEGAVSPYEVALKRIPEQTVATIRQIVPHVSQMKEYRCDEFDLIYAWLQGVTAERAGAELAIYHAEEFDERNIDMEVGYIIPADAAALTPPAPIQIHDLPAVDEMATVMHRGDMWDEIYAIIALYRWTYANGRVCVGPYRELHPHWRETEHENFGDVIVELQLPVAPATN